MLEGALATLLAERYGDGVVQRARAGADSLAARYDAAVVSDRLPPGVRADLLVTLPDTRGSGGTGQVAVGGQVADVTISGADSIMELIDRYLTDPPGTTR